MEVAAMALLALPTAWLLSLDEEGAGPWLLAVLWIGLTAWNTVLGLFSLPAGTIVWLVLRRGRNRRELVQFVNQQGWTEAPAPAGFVTGYQGTIAGRPARVLVGYTLTSRVQGKRYIQPILGFQLVEGDWPEGWEAARQRRRGLFLPADLPYRVEPGLLVFEGVPRVKVIQDRLRDLEASFEPGFDWSRLGKRKKMHPALFWGLILLLVVAGASQWLAWQKLRVFPAEPSLLWRSLSSLPRIQTILRSSSDPFVAAAQEQFAVGGEYQPIRLYTADGKELRSLPDSEGWKPLAFSGPDLAACDPKAGTVRIFPSTDLGVQNGPTALAASGEYVACGGKANEVVVYARKGGVVSRMTRPMAPVSALSCSGERGLCGTQDGGLYLFELATGRLLAEREGTGKPIKAVAFSDQGLVSMGEEGCLAWSEGLKTSTVLSPEPATAGTAGRVLCLGRADGTILVLGRRPLKLVGHQAPVTSLALSPDGQRLYSGANDYSVKIWKLD